MTFSQSFAGEETPIDSADYVSVRMLPAMYKAGVFLAISVVFLLMFACNKCICRCFDNKNRRVLSCTTASADEPAAKKELLIGRIAWGVITALVIIFAIVGLAGNGKITDGFISAFDALVAPLVNLKGATSDLSDLAASYNTIAANHATVDAIDVPVDALASAIDGAIEIMTDTRTAFIDYDSYRALAAGLGMSVWMITAIIGVLVIWKLESVKLIHKITIWVGLFAGVLTYLAFAVHLPFGVILADVCDVISDDPTAAVGRFVDCSATDSATAVNDSFGEGTDDAFDALEAQFSISSAADIMNFYPTRHAFTAAGTTPPKTTVYFDGLVDDAKSNSDTLPARSTAVESLAGAGSITTQASDTLASFLDCDLMINETVEGVTAGFCDEALPGLDDMVMGSYVVGLFGFFWVGVSMYGARFLKNEPSTAALEANEMKKF